MSNYLWMPEQLDIFYKTLFELKENPTIEELAKKVNMPKEAVEIIVGGGLDLKHFEMKDDRIYVTPMGEEFYKSMEGLKKSTQSHNPTDYYVV